MKPKMYRKTKTSKGSNIASFKNNAGGGAVKGIIIGPLTSTGTAHGKTVANPHKCDGSAHTEQNG